MATHSSILAWKFHGQILVGCSPWSLKESGMTELLSPTLVEACEYSCPVECGILLPWPRIEPMEDRLVFFYWLINFNWRIITILWWLCHTSELIGHRCTCVPHPEPLRPTLSIWVVPEHWLWVPCFIHQTYSGEDRFWTNGPRGESPRDELCFFPFILFFFQLCVTC